MINNRNFQRQSVVTILNEKPHFVKLVNKKLFKKTALDEFLNCRNTDFREQSNSCINRGEFKLSKLDHKSFVHSQKCPKHNNKKFVNCFLCKKNKRKDYKYLPGGSLKSKKRALLNTEKSAKKSLNIDGFVTNEERKSTKYKKDDGLYNKTSLIKGSASKQVSSSRVYKPYKGSFCKTQNPTVKESSSNDVLKTKKDYKTPLKTAKVSVNLVKGDKTPAKDPFVASITLDVKTDEKKITQIDRSSPSISNNQLLSNKMLLHAKSSIKPSPFQSDQRHKSKEKMKTSLEIYSKTIRHSKVDKSSNSHQRNWSDIYTDESKHGNVSATAISARSDMKNSFGQDDFSRRAAPFMFKNHYSEIKKRLNATDSPDAQNLRSDTKFSNYLKKMDNGPKFGPKKGTIKVLNHSGNISSRKETQDIPQIDTNSSVQYSTVELFTEEDSNDFMFSLPIDECFDLINYEPQSGIDPLAQAIPSLNTKTKQTPKKEESKTQKKVI